MSGRIGDRPEYDGLFSWLWLLRQHEREEAELLLRKGPVYYCAGKGHPVVVCRTIDEFRCAQGRHGVQPKDSIASYGDA